MGDPKKPRKKFHRPRIIWQRDLIEEQKELIKEYGLKNKKEIWRIESQLKKFREQAKNLIVNKTEQGKKETADLIARLAKLNLISPKARLEDILVLKLKDLLERRMQTLVLRKNLAKTINQARQFIVHSHISIGDNKLNIPSYFVTLDEENQISFSKNSSLHSSEHPERLKERSKKGKAIKKKETVEEVIAKEIENQLEKNDETIKK